MYYAPGPYDHDSWSDWPYSAHEPERAREIRDLMEVVSDYEEAADPDTRIHYEPQEINEDLLERLEEALSEIGEEVCSLEARYHHARDAEKRIETLLLSHYESELDEDKEDKENDEQSGY